MIDGIELQYTNIIRDYQQVQRNISDYPPITRNLHFYSFLSRYADTCRERTIRCKLNFLWPNIQGLPNKNNLHSSKSIQ